MRAVLGFIWAAGVLLLALVEIWVALLLLETLIVEGVPGWTR